MAQNGLIEPAALTSVFIVFVYSAKQVYASNPSFMWDYLRACVGKRNFATQFFPTMYSCLAMTNFKELFDNVIDRHSTCAVKYEMLDELYGRHDLLPMWVADMDLPVMPEITEALARRLSHPVFGYSVPPESYWQAIIDWQRSRNGFEIRRDDLLHVPGIVKGIAYAINRFTDVGDRVVIQPPVYHPFRNVAEANRRVVVENPLVETSDGYEMDLNHLEHVFATERPKLMILCNPHNPIGICWPADVLGQVAALARQYGVVVVSDEIHGDLIHKGFRHTPFASVSDDAAAVSVTFGAPSKTFNVAGITGSWCVVKNPELRERFFTWMEANGFAEASLEAPIVAEAAYRHGAEWVDNLVEYIAGNVAALESALAAALPEVRVIRPQASFLVWLDFRRLRLDHDALIDRIVNHARLALNDGAMFGRQGDGFMRMNVGCPRAVVAEAADRLARAF